MKKAGKRALQELKKAKYIQTDDAKTVNYDDDINIDDSATVGYNSDREIDVADNGTLSTSVAQQQAKRIIKKHKNLKRKAGKINQKTKKEKMTTSYLLNKCPCTLEKGWRWKQENKKMKASSLLNKSLYTLGKG